MSILFGNLRSFLLVGSFVAGMLVIPVAQLSTNAFLILEALILVAANVIFMRWFSLGNLLAMATLLSYDLLVILIIWTIAIALHYPQQTELADLLISTISILAVVYPITQAVFVRTYWS